MSEVVLEENNNLSTTQQNLPYMESKSLPSCSKVKVKVKFRIGALKHRSLKAYCAITPKEFLHSSLEALHTERYAAPQLAKEGTM
jgi:hypothetical protein